MGDSSRLEELRRRVQQDPASIAFAALAEEYRKAGHLAEAIDTCRAGLHHHPAYILARVTLGRALHEAGHHDEAAAEFEDVVKVAPENLTAQRSLVHIYTVRGDRARALAALKTAVALAPQDADLQAALDALGRDAAAPSAPAPPPRFEASRFGVGPVPTDRPSDDEFARDAEVRARTLVALESLLAAVHRARGGERRAEYPAGA